MAKPSPTIVGSYGEELRESNPQPKQANKTVVPMKKTVSRTKATDTAPEATVPVQIEKVTLYLPKPVYRYIKQKALDFDRKPHDLLIEGIEMLLRKDGKTIAALIGK